MKRYILFICFLITHSSLCEAQNLMFPYAYRSGHFHWNYFSDDFSSAICREYTDNGDCCICIQCARDTLLSMFEISDMQRIEINEISVDRSFYSNLDKLLKTAVMTSSFFIPRTPYFTSAPTLVYLNSGEAATVDCIYTFGNQNRLKKLYEKLNSGMRNHDITKIYQLQPEIESLTESFRAEYAKTNRQHKVL